MCKLLSHPRLVACLPGISNLALRSAYKYIDCVGEEVATHQHVPQSVRFYCTKFNNAISCVCPRWVQGNCSKRDDEKLCNSRSCGVLVPNFDSDFVVRFHGLDCHRVWLCRVNYVMEGQTFYLFGRLCSKALFSLDSQCTMSLLVQCANHHDLHPCHVSVVSVGYCHTPRISGGELVCAG